MAVVVVAQRPAGYRRGLANQKRPAAAGGAAGEVFASESCASCHTIRGTAATGTVGPGLTHVASRQTLAALAIPNTRAVRRAWIRDPGRFKPGTRMPKVPLTGKQLEQLVAYLEGLR
jgi:Cytochrome c1